MEWNVPGVGRVDVLEEIGVEPFEYDVHLGLQVQEVAHVVLQLLDVRPVDFFSSGSLRRCPSRLLSVLWSSYPPTIL